MRELVVQHHSAVFFLALLFMALLSFLPEHHSKEQIKQHKKGHSKCKKKQQQQQQQQSSWDHIKKLLTCRQMEGSQVHDPSKNVNNGGYSRLGSCSSICNFKDVVHGNTRVVHRADNSPEGSTVGQDTRLLNRKTGQRSMSSSSSSSRSLSSSVRSNGAGGANYTSSSSSSSRGMHFGKLSGCYECHMIVDPSRYPTPRTTICACSECGEVFPKIESLEHHQAIKHAVLELGPEDSGRNIVEIIFKSSWLKKDNPICKIERILKVHNTQKTIQRFEDCREVVKHRANANTRKNPRCAADGNELLRFHCTTLVCSLGENGSTSLCGSAPGCGVCTIIRHGFQDNMTSGVRTTASSGRAHDCLEGSDGRRAMIVCRVIAGRVRHMADAAAAPAPDQDGGVCGGESYDSIASYTGLYSTLEELYVFNPRAILPCFVVIYKALESSYV